MKKFLVIDQIVYVEQMHVMEKIWKNVEKFLNSNSKTKNNGVSLVLPSAIASKTLWYNKKINIDNKSIYLYGISEKGSNDAGHLLNESQKLKS